jgi:hypothetical protein
MDSSKMRKEAKHNRRTMGEEEEEIKTGTSKEGNNRTGNTDPLRLTT